MQGKPDFDVIVVGGGPVGLAAAYNCAKRGKSTLVLERFSFFNQSGSSNDLVRMFRTMYTQAFMADLAKQAIGLWKELERDAGQSLIWMTGLLNFGDPNYKSGPEGNLLDPIANLKRLNMPYRVLEAPEIMREYPFKDLPNDFVGIFAPDNGCINVPQVLRSLYELSSACGATLQSHVRVEELRTSEAGVSVRARLADGETKSLTASKCIVAAGAYTNQILRSLDVQLKISIWEMVYEYYATDPTGRRFPSMWFQFMDPTDGDPAKSNLFYGFPSVPWAPRNLTRIAVDNAVNVITDPSQRGIAPSANDLSITADFVQQHCVDVDDRPNFSGTCLQTNVCDNMYVLDQLPPAVGPGHENVAVFTAGWGFKLVPLLGKALSELVCDGSSYYDLSQFKMTRPGILA